MFNIYNRAILPSQLGIFSQACPLPHCMASGEVGFREYPAEHVTLTEVPVEPPFAGVMLSELAIEWVPEQVFASQLGIFSHNWPAPHCIASGVAGFNEYPAKQVTLTDVPVDPPLAGLMLAELVIEWVPVQVFASQVGLLSQLFDVPHCMLPFPGFKVYPLLHTTVKAVPVEPPFDGIMLFAFVMECVPEQVLARLYIQEKEKPKCAYLQISVLKFIYFQL